MVANKQILTPIVSVAEQAHLILARAPVGRIYMVLILSDLLVTNLWQTAKRNHRVPEIIRNI